MAEKLKVLDLFSGIGGFSLGLERTGGFETVAFCEIDPFCQKVLKKHWPNVPIYNDVRTLDYDGTVDVITGGFPCQDISVAGRKAGLDGERSGLWEHVARIIGDLRPKYVIVENVSNLLSGPSEQPGKWFSRVLGDLAEIGYDAEWHCVPASYIGAWHRRDRVWILAHANGERGQQGKPQGPIFRQRHLQIKPERAFKKWAGRSGIPQPAICGRNDGIPDVPHRLKALGNSVVPQIPEIIGHAILQAEKRGDLAHVSEQLELIAEILK